MCPLFSMGLCWGIVWNGLRALLLKENGSKKKWIHFALFSDHFGSPLIICQKVRGSLENGSIFEGGRPPENMEGVDGF